MAKIFISHSSKDEKIVKLLTEFLQMGMGIARENIFCTSYSKTLRTGEAFIEEIREAMQDCEMVFFLITDHFLESQFCLTEMGAAWGLGKRICPLLLVDVSCIEHTPLKGIQVRFLKESEDVSAVYDELRDAGIITSTSTAEYIKRLPAFMETLQSLTVTEGLLSADEEGYYHTEIVECRKISSPKWRCYRIKGHLEPWKDPESAKTDWILYSAGKYEDLKPGDRIRFKFSKTKESVWDDIGRARDIYPLVLEKE